MRRPAPRASRLGHFRPRMERLEDRTVPATISWNVNANGYWDVASNWRDDQGVSRLPGLSDDVVIDRPAGNYTVTTRSGSLFAKSITSVESLTLLGGELTVTGSIQVNGSAAFTLDGGALSCGSIAAGTTLAVGESSGYLNGVTIAGTLALSGGKSVEVNSGLTLAGGTVAINDSFLSFAGTQTFSGTGSVVFEGERAGSLQVASSDVTLTIGAGITIHGKFGSIGAYEGIVNNYGTITADVADGIIQVDASFFVNEGTISATNGTLSIRPNLTFAGAGRIESSRVGKIRLFNHLIGNGTDPARFVPAGLTAFELFNNGQPQLEAMSRDRGASESDFAANFAFGDLSIAEGLNVQLIDDFVNNTNGEGPEVVYVNHLSIAAGGTLDLNGRKLYARTTDIAGTVVGGSVLIVQPFTTEFVPSSGSFRKDQNGKWFSGYNATGIRIHVPDAEASENYTFEVRLDGGSWFTAERLESGQGLVYFNFLPPGEHLLEARAVDANGIADSTPAKFSWLIDQTPPTVVSVKTNFVVLSQSTFAHLIKVVVKYSEPMYLEASPTIIFTPNVPGTFLTNSLVKNTTYSTWTCPTEYVAFYYVFPVNQEVVTPVLVQVSGALDFVYNSQTAASFTNVFHIDTLRPQVVRATSNLPRVSTATTAPLYFAVDFSRAMNTAIQPTLIFISNALKQDLADSHWLSATRFMARMVRTTNASISIVNPKIVVTGAFDTQGIQRVSNIADITVPVTVDTKPPQVAKVSFPNVLTSQLRVSRTTRGFVVRIDFNEAMDPTYAPKVLSADPSLTTLLSMTETGRWSRSGLDLAWKTYTITIGITNRRSTADGNAFVISKLRDAVGNVMLPMTVSNRLLVDLSYPTVLAVKLLDPLVVAAGKAGRFEVTFSEVVTGVGPDDFKAELSSGTAGFMGAITGVVRKDDRTFTVTMKKAGSGTGFLKLKIVDNNTVTDLAGNPLGGPLASDGTYTHNLIYDFK